MNEVSKERNIVFNISPSTPFPLSDFVNSLNVIQNAGIESI